MPGVIDQPGPQAREAQWEVVHAKAITDAAAMAKRDAQRAIKREIPDPREFAYALPQAQVAALLQCWRRGTWHAPRSVLADLRPWGLCEVGGNGLTAFGMAVLRVLREEHDA